MIVDPIMLLFTIGELMKRFCIMIPPKHFDIPPPLTGGCSEGRSRRVQIFLKTTTNKTHNTYIYTSTYIRRSAWEGVECAAILFFFFFFLLFFSSFFTYNIQQTTSKWDWPPCKKVSIFFGFATSTLNGGNDKQHQTINRRVLTV